MRQKDVKKAEEIDNALVQFSSEIKSLPGLNQFENRITFVEQLLESIRRVQYIHVLRDKEHSPLRIKPESDIFDPLRAAALHRTQGNIEEACWLVFLATHFGKHGRSGWNLVKAVYGALNTEAAWTWEKISSDPQGISRWLDENYKRLTSDGVPRGFGNHRKYESLRPDSDKGTGAVVESYVHWILQCGSHAQLFEDALAHGKQDPKLAFKRLYETMHVLRFGRTAKFDYLTMIAKLKLANISPDCAYMVGSTGPIRGARLLFGGTVKAPLSPEELEPWLVKLGAYTGLGMQELEDALCNWQKAPSKFAKFRG